MKTATVTLRSVMEKEKSILSQLLYDYQRELLRYSGKSLDEIKTYKYLPEYFTDSERAAFFILVDGEIGGFILVNTHTIIEARAHSIAEFYIFPGLRRSGIGARAAALAFAKFPGRWEVAQMDVNQIAIDFWRKTINKITSGRYEDVRLDIDSWRGPVQIFDVN